MHDAEAGEDLTPPHDITGKKITRHLPSGKLGDLFLDLQKQSYELLKNHPINVKRIAEGKNPANSIWLWGEGTKPALPDFYEKNGIHGAVISAVDLLKGIGKGAGMEVINVEGATGNVNTDFAAKGQAAIEALKTLDYVYIHVEAPDESGHQGSLTDKITAIEKIDSDIVGPVLAYLESTGEPYHVLVCPDHPTPLATRTHSAEPIPYLIYKSDTEVHSGVDRYDEESAKSTGVYLEEGYHLIDKLISQETEGNIEGLTPDLVTYSDGTEESISEQKAEADDNGEQAAPAEAPQETPAPEKKKGGFGAFFKRHLLLFIILIASIVVAGGVTAGHFIATYHYSFIRTESDVEEAIAKENINRLIFKKDVTVSKDLSIDHPIDLDLNGYTFTVEGTLSLSVPEDVTIGYKKGKTYRVGGTIAAEEINVIGTASLNLLADIQANKVFIACNKMDLQGSASGKDLEFSVDASEATISGSVVGTVKLSATCALAISNDVSAIAGGREIKLTSGNVGTICETQTVYVYEGAQVDEVINVTNYYRVTTLVRPFEIYVVNEDNEFYCYVPEVIGATHITYSINDIEKESVPVAKNATTKFKIKDITPGKQTLKLRATAPDDPRFLDSEEYVYTFDFALQLDEPKISLDVTDDKVELVVDTVLYAEKYTYFINGESTTVTSTNGLRVDVKDKVQEGGVYVIKVIAQSNNDYFTDSNYSLMSYIKRVTLATPVVTATADDGGLTFTWEEISGRSDYYITYGTYTCYKKANTVSLPYIEGASFSVSAIGGGYYDTGAAYVMTAEQIAELIIIPEEEQPNEQGTESGEENGEQSGDKENGEQGSGDSENDDIPDVNEEESTNNDPTEEDTVNEE